MHKIFFKIKLLFAIIFKNVRREKTEESRKAGDENFYVEIYKREERCKKRKKG